MTDAAPPEARGERGPPVRAPPRPRKQWRKAVLGVVVIGGSLHQTDTIGKVA